MTAAVQCANLVMQFSCKGESCEDTCCQGWSMQVDELTLTRYRNDAPDLLHAVESDGADGGVIMRKNSGTGVCVKFAGGLCGIHKQYGENMLGDACYFYPRVTRAIGKNIYMTASLSCPEVARLAFSMNDPHTLHQKSFERLPYGMKDYLPGELSEQQALAVHQAFLETADNTDLDPERIVARMVSVSNSFDYLKKKDWPAAAAFYLRNADARLPAPDMRDNDPYNLLLSLAGLIVASQKPVGDRLRQTIADMETALGAKINWQTLQIDIADDAMARCARMKELWRHTFAVSYRAVLRRWIAAQLSLALYPFGGLGETLAQRATIIGVRFALFKLALLSASVIQERVLTEEQVVRIAQSLARFLDHLGDANYSLAIYSETGWTSEKRLRGLAEFF